MDITALMLCPLDVRADILLRAVEDGAHPNEVEATAAACNGETLAAFRRRLRALYAFGSQRSMVEASLRDCPEQGRRRALPPLEVSR